jgi:NADH-quinone oxidoreductase subunit C
MSLETLIAKLTPMAVCAVPPPPPAPAAAKPAPAAAKPAASAEGGAAPAPAPAAPAPVAPAAPSPADPVPWVFPTDHKKRGTDLDVTVPPERIAEAARVLDEAGYAIEAIGGVDWMAEKQIEIVYDFTDFQSGRRVELRTRVPRDKPEAPTISAVYPGANWHEREARDFFGIVFAGHPDPIPLLLPEDATFHPLRKDFGA